MRCHVNGSLKNNKKENYKHKLYDVLIMNKEVKSITFQDDYARGMVRGPAALILKGWFISALKWHINRMRFDHACHCNPNNCCLYLIFNMASMILNAHRG